MDYSNPPFQLDQIFYHYIFPLFVLSLLLLFAWGWFIRQCPSCKRSWARKLKKRVELGEKLVIKDEIKDSGQRDAEGRVVSVPVRVPYMRAHFRNYWICKYCGYEGWKPSNFHKDREA